MYTPSTTSATHRNAHKHFFGRMAGLVSSFAARMHQRSELAQLAEMTDSQLADIGLTRNDVRHALNLPLGDDPASSLMRARANNIRRS